MKLSYKIIQELHPDVPFNFDATFYKPAHFPSGDNTWKSGTRWQTFRFAGKNLGVIFKNTGSTNNPTIRVEIYSSRKLSEDLVITFLNEIKYRYNLDLDVMDFYKRFTTDIIVGPAIKRLYGMRPGHQDSLYEYLIIGIVLQNCTVARSIQMMQILFEKYGTQVKYAGKKLWCFWEPGGLKNVSENELRDLKLGYRAKSIKKIDDQFVNGKMDEIALRREDVETQKKELLKLFGVGPATVWYLLFDVFHQYDFFSLISPWEQKIYSKLFFHRDSELSVPVAKLIAYFKRFKPYQQLAVNYVWEDLWWQHKKKPIPWLKKEIRNGAI
ncbi:MAG: DNA-3-methyladenine glycosylase II [Candidatus Gottesmanbacteria bacterium GW2011_GWB1_44_11c]|uniref:DNA-3-methyladenine glycosylase II n=2 Tax=Candidatus Gottesmaniibacteriota TaxID=1752720 RepID=A0A0G1KXD4_9BACT|nr:MAG: DNA-3-methyladenine glycosylase II [Candidatus Gottesmanbacteria bacterium GW2011_GWB1_44_11c]KKT60987.1 MAG: DNA-3-methyladenine glycosylase II [Candidatus Gottesmanbacteria bacterium GW2011_GWA1_44_24b]HCM82771.1 hypothetical protein [Patescibacteria group bacterium]